MILGIDVGGTFTDLLLINEESGETYTAKVLSTPEDSSVGVLTGVERICSESGVDPQQPPTTETPNSARSPPPSHPHASSWSPPPPCPERR